jgi:GTPase SAR1 family protein
MEPVGESSDFEACPIAVFVGDFNTGKSSLINALLGKDLLRVTREESRALPTVVMRGPGADTSFAAFPHEGMEPHAKTHEQFLGLCDSPTQLEHYRWLVVRHAAAPFSRLAFVDTRGISVDDFESFPLHRIQPPRQCLLVLVTDVEYWNAKHTLQFLKEHYERFHRQVLVVGNKADHLNAKEFRKIRDRAMSKMEAFGITPAPRFFILSARLELGRNKEGDEFRTRIRQEVCDLCDGGFDAFRVALYEFESRHLPEATWTWQEVAEHPFIRALVDAQKGSSQ